MDGRFSVVIAWTRLPLMGVLANQHLVGADSAWPLLVLWARGRKVQIEPYAGHANGKAKQCGANGEEAIVKMKFESHCGESCPTRGRYRVETTRKDRWYSSDNDIADSSTSDRGNGAKDYRLKWAKVGTKGHSGAGNAEQGKARSIKHGDETSDPHPKPTGDKSDNSRAACNCQVTPVSKRGWRQISNEYVADDPTAECGYDGEDDNADEIEILALHGYERAVESEDERARELQDDLQSSVGVEHGTRS